MAISESFDLISHSVGQTARFGIRLGQLLAAGDVICLSGELGAGKTAFAAGVGTGWGALEPVTSPTFVFVHEHRRAPDALRLYHLDCYRLNSVNDADSVGIEELLAGDAIAMIEWPERIDERLPSERLWIALEFAQSDAERHIIFAASGMRYVTLLNQLQREHAAGN